jgi:hypothetical protein
MEICCKLYLISGGSTSANVPGPEIIVTLQMRISIRELIYGGSDFKMINAKDIPKAK